MPRGVGEEMPVLGPMLTATSMTFVPLGIVPDAPPQTPHPHDARMIPTAPHE